MTQDERIQLELAGVIDVEGGIDRFFPLAGWRVPDRITLAATENGFQLEADYSATHPVIAGRNLLTDFLKLGTAPDRMLRFALRWGLLGSLDERTNWGQGRSALATDGPIVEPLSRWVHYQRRFTAILKCAAAFRNERQPEESVWCAAMERYEPEPEAAPLFAFSSSERELAYEVNWMLWRLRATPMIEWRDRSVPRLQVASDVPSLLTALVYRVALAFCSVDEVPICSGCGRIYEVGERRPKAGQRQFCAQCRAEGIPKRLATRDARQRQREREGSQSIAATSNDEE